MTPGARIQASIELLDSILLFWQSEKRIPADKLIDNYFRDRRFIGSKDRASIGELVYWCLRHKATLEWWLKDKLEADIHARAMVLTALMLRKDYDAASITLVTQDSQYSLPSLTALEKERCEQLYAWASRPPLEGGQGFPLETQGGYENKSITTPPESASADSALPQGEGGRVPRLSAKILAKVEADSNIVHPDMPEHARLNYPLWLEPILKESLGKDFEPALAALNEQAPTDLRVNTLKTTREKLHEDLKAEGFENTPTTLSPIGLRLARRMPIFTSKYFKEGHFEVQDEGSQLVSLLVDAKPGQKVIDFCAGAGGKTLGIAAAMENKGRILAWDNSEKRLAQIVLRLRRAGVHNVQAHVITSEHDAFIKRHKQSADRVLVDAPCSGSGTWRRNPDIKWRFTQKDMDEMLVLQQSILQSAARLVKPGGRLIYATCSLFKSENNQQIEVFLKTSNDFRVVSVQKIWDKSSGDEGLASYLWVTPHQDGVDGFFAAVLERQ